MTFSKTCATLFYILLVTLLSTPCLEAHSVNRNTRGADEEKPDYDKPDYDKPENDKPDYDKPDNDKPEKPDYDKCCDNGAKMHSYHIHVLFWTASKDRTASALTLRGEFIEKFGLEGKECEMNRGDPAPGHEMCSYPVVWEPEAPFPTSEFSFFVPFKDIQRASEWMLQHRGDHDVFIHPNTGCEQHDHLLWSTWSGDKWPLDASIFSCNYPGCKPLNW